MNFPATTYSPAPTSPVLTGVSDTLAPVVVAPNRSLTKTVLHVINGEHFSGAERVQQLLGKQLPVQGFKAHFACVKPGKFRVLCGLPENSVIDVPMRGRFDFTVVRQLMNHITANSVELMHAHTPRTALVTSMVAWRTGLPWIYHVHSPTSRDSTRGIVNRLNSFIERYSIRNCNCIITVSASLAREMQRLGANAERVVTVANGVPANKPIDATTRIAHSNWRLGMVALMRPRKGVEVALHAMQRLKELGCPVSLELIGGFETPEYDQQIRALIVQLNVSDCVQLSGFTKDAPAAIRQLDALLLPSLFGEGMPMVVLEALAAAVPVIATSVEGTPEVIRDGVEGFLAEPRSVDSLVEKILQMASDRSAWVAMSDRAQLRHREAFSDLRMAEGVAAAYNSVLRHYRTI